MRVHQLRKQQAEGKRHFEVKKANSKPSGKDKDHTWRKIGRPGINTT